MARPIGTAYRAGRVQLGGCPAVSSWATQFDYRLALPHPPAVVSSQAPAQGLAGV